MWKRFVSVTLQEEAAVALCGFFSVPLTMRVGLWESLSGDQVHDGGSAWWQLQGSQGNVAMKEASLEDEAQDAGAAHRLLLPSCGPVVKHMLGDVCGRVIWGESEVLRFPADQD